MSYEERISVLRGSFIDTLMGLPGMNESRELRIVLSEFISKVDKGDIYIYPTPLAYKIRSHVEEQGTAVLYIPDDFDAMTRTPGLRRSVLSAVVDAVFYTKGWNSGLRLHKVGQVKERLLRATEEKTTRDGEDD